jgi:hypothetical protein
MEITLPTSFSEVTLKQFMTVNKVKDIEEIDREVSILSALTEQPKEIIEQLTLDSFKTAIAAISKLNIEELKDLAIPDDFTIGGKQYTICKSIDKWTAGQYIDITAFTKDADTIIENLHNIMAVVAIEKGCKYENHAERAELFLNKMTVDIAYPAAFFFLNLYQILMLDTLSYSQKEIDQKIAIARQEVLTSIPIMGG